MAVVEVVTEAQSLEDLRVEWQELMSGCPTATVFQSHEWIATWWRFFGRTRLGRRLFVVTVRQETDRKLIGLAPLMTSFWYALPVLRRLSFLGEGASDYQDILAASGREDEVCDEIYSFLGKSRSWQVGDLNQLREGGLLAQSAPADRAGVVYKDNPQEECPYLPYPSAKDPSEDGSSKLSQETISSQKWTLVLGALGKKMRYNVGYYERLLRRTSQVEIGVANDPKEVDEALTELFELHQRRWNQRWMPGVFGNKRVQAFHRAVTAKFLERGWLRMHTLKLDGEIEAVLYCFSYGSRTCYYQAGFEPTLAKLSLGTVLTAHAIRTSIEEGREEFDFLRGSEPYKQRWTGGRQRMNSRRLIGRRGSAGLALATRVGQLEHSVETRFKDWMHHRFEGREIARDPQP